LAEARSNSRVDLGRVSGNVETTSRYFTLILAQTLAQAQALGAKLSLTLSLEIPACGFVRLQNGGPFAWCFARDSWHQSRHNGIRFRRFVTRFAPPFRVANHCNLSRILLFPCLSPARRNPPWQSSEKTGPHHPMVIQIRDHQSSL
jgi:hypothetical protein